MSRFLDQLQAGLIRCGLPGQRILLAISGGADSMAMLRGMLQLQPHMDYQLQAAHFNHHLRGQESVEDARWVEASCRQWAVPITLGEEDIATRATALGWGIEETARTLRYTFLNEAALHHNCTHVATAHTADDQAETILHHILRGTGLRGLMGMAPVRPLASGRRLVRPLLEISRAEIEAYLKDLGQDVRLDPSNLDPCFTRNRIRLELMPVLEQHYNPQVRTALRRLGRQASEVTEAVEQVAARLLERSLEEKDAASCRLNCEILADQPRHLIRECFTLLWRDRQWPRKRMGFTEWNRLADVVQHGGTITLPGNIEARRRGRSLVLTRR